LTILGTASLTTREGNARVGLATFTDGRTSRQIAMRVLAKDNPVIGAHGPEWARLTGCDTECVLMKAVRTDGDEYAPMEWHGYPIFDGYHMRIQIDPATYAVTFWDCIQPYWPPVDTSPPSPSP